MHIDVRLEHKTRAGIFAVSILGIGLGLGLNCRTGNGERAAPAPSEVRPARRPLGAPDLSTPQTVPSPKVVTATEPVRFTLPKAVYHPREPGEWDGMLVNVSLGAACDVSRRCGLAAACLDGKCGPCQGDSQCAPGEVCVLDHCLLRENVECRSRRHCKDSDLCVLSGYSDGPRGNETMRATCMVPSGTDPSWQQPPPQPGEPAEPAEVDPQRLLDDLERAANPKK